MRLLGRDGLREPREPRAFLVAIAKGLLFDYFRRAALEQAYLTELMLIPEGEQPSVEEQQMILEDLNAIEVALSYERLLEECKLTQEQLSEKVAKSRSHIANHLRLLKLPDAIQAAVRDKQITMGHARALLALTTENEQLLALARILDEQLSVRDVEALSKPEKQKAASTPSAGPKAKISLITTEKLYLSYLSEQLGTKVSIDKTPEGKGKLIVHFTHESELQRLIEMLKKSE